IESAISCVEGIDTVQSQSQSGSLVVRMMFKNGTDLDHALLDVRERVDHINRRLSERSADPSIMRVSPDQMTVMWVGLSGKDAEALTKIADDQIVPYFERQGGVASVTVEGAKEREIQLMLDQAKLDQYGVSPQAIIE